MPWSAEEGKPVVRQRVKLLSPTSVLDVGAGAGYYGRMIRRLNPDALIHAVEIWRPYVRRFELEGTYDKIFVKDVRKFQPEQNYDLVVLGDVLEHMTKDEAVETLARLRRYAKNVLISLPIIEWHQGAEEGNPYEAHVYHWDHAQATECFEPTFSWTGPHIGVYVLDGV